MPASPGDRAQTGRIVVQVDTLDRLLKALAVRLHAFSVCEVQEGWQLAFPAFEAITVHYVLKGSGAFRVGNGPPHPFATRSVLVVPARQSHVLGELESPQVVRAEDRCSMLGDGLVTFTAGDGSRDTLLLCGAIPATYGDALALFDLLREPMVGDASAGGVHHQTFDLMLAEVTKPGLGTQAMAELLMKQCLLALLRHRMREDAATVPLHAAFRQPRLGRAVLAVIEDPAAPHSVESLAGLAGMSRASFAEHFSRAFQQGPMEFVQKNRLRIGARLLTTTDLPIKVIAQSAGYAGATPFSRAFRAAYGTDPAAYRGLVADEDREPAPDAPVEDTPPRIRPTPDRA